MTAMPGRMADVYKRQAVGQPIGFFLITQTMLHSQVIYILFPFRTMPF